MNKQKYTSLILLVIVIALYNWWISPGKAEIREMKAELATLESQVNTTTRDEEAQRDVVLTEIDLQLLDEAIPQGFDQEFLIKIINQIAEDNVTRINSINFNKSSASVGGIQTVQLSISGNTALENMEQFIHDLENNNRTFIIRNLSLSYSESEGVERANFTINLESYFT